MRNKTPFPIKNSLGQSPVDRIDHVPAHRCQQCPRAMHRRNLRLPRPTTAALTVSESEGAQCFVDLVTPRKLQRSGWDSKGLREAVFQLNMLR
jgi:hypothetical protein